MNAKSLSNFIAFILNKSNNNHNNNQTKQKITRIKRMNRGYFTVAQRDECYFRVPKQYFTNEGSEWVKYCFCACHEKIKFISSSHRVMFFLFYRQKEIDKIIKGITEITSSINSRVRSWKIKHLGPRCSFFLWILRVLYFQ